MEMEVIQKKVRNDSYRQSVLDLSSLSDGQLATKHLLSFEEQVPNMLR